MTAGEDLAHRFDVTAVFLEDAIHGRRSTHKIDATSLRLYRLYYNSTYTAILHTVMALHIVLVTLLEPADSCRGAVNKTTPLAAWLNLLFCTLYAIDAGIQAAFRGIPYVRYHTWYIVKLSVLFVMVCDSITALCGVNCLWSRPIRPLIIIARLVNVRALCVSILRTIPKVLNVAILLVFNLLVFTFLGHEIFRDSVASDSRREFVIDQTNATIYIHSFSTFGESLDALFKLLTTVNFPDVMLPYYRQNRWSALFFISYLLIGLFFLSNLLLAVVYQYYREFTLERTVIRLRRRHRALQLAFRALSGHLNLDADAVYHMNYSVDINSHTWSAPGKNSPAGSEWEQHGYELQHLARQQPRAPAPAPAPAPDVPTYGRARSLGGIPSVQLSRSLRTNLQQGVQRQREQLEEQLTRDHANRGGRSVASGLRSMVGLLSSTTGTASEAVTNAPLNEAPPAWLVTEEQWTRLMQTLRPSVTPEVSCIMFRAVDRERSGAISESSASCPSQRAGTSMTRLRALLPRLDTAGFMDLCEYLSLTVQPKALPRRRSTWVSRLRSTLHGIATHPSFRPAFDVLVLVNTALIVIQSFDNDDQGLSEALRVATMSLLAVFVVEMAVMLGGLGFDKFVQSSFNVLDLSSVLLAVISSIVLQSLDSSTDRGSGSEGIISVIRVFRLLRTIRLLKHFSSVISALGLMLPVLFRFGGLMLLYMYSFSVIGMEAFAHRITEATVKKSLYAVNDYYPITFDDLGSAMVTVFELLVVNNWNIIASGAVECCGSGSIAYFVLFYVTAVMIIMNVVIAFVLETFMSHWLSMRTGGGGAPPWEVRLERAQHEEYGGNLKWDMRRKRRHSDVYKNIFKDELPQSFIRPWKAMHLADGTEEDTSEKQEPQPQWGGVRSFRNPVVEEMHRGY